MHLPGYNTITIWLAETCNVISNNTRGTGKNILMIMPEMKIRIKWSCKGRQASCWVNNGGGRQVQWCNHRRKAIRWMYARRLDSQLLVNNFLNGNSIVAITQWLLACNSPLKVIYPIKSTHNIYRQEACRPIQPAPHSNYSVLQMPARGC